MYAVVSTGGKQYKVAKGDLIDVEKLNVEPGDKVELDVLMLNDGKKTTVVGLEKTKIECTVVDHHKGEKQLVFKFHKRKRYQRTRGHRQNYTRLEVGDIPASARKRRAPKKTAAAKNSTKKTEAATSSETSE